MPRPPAPCAKDGDGKSRPKGGKAPARSRGVRAAGLLPRARLAGPVPWVIAIMTALAVVAAAAALSLAGLVSGARAGLAGGVTVQIVEADAPARQRQAQAAERALTVLPDVAAVRIVPQSEIAALVEPWLGADATDASGADDDAVPIPALLDVTLQGPADAAALARIAGALADVAPAARVDAQAAWLRPVFAALRSLQFLALGLAVGLAVTCAAAVFLAARSALGANRQTLEIVHLLGGTDMQVARVFQRSVAVDAAWGSLAGLIVGGGVALLVGSRFARLDSGLIGGGALGVWGWAAILLVPVAMIALATLTARWTVTAALGRMV